MLTAIFGFSGALVFGSADFLGGLASRRISPLRVTAIAAVAGLIVLLIATIFVGGVWSPAAIGWGALSGVAGALAISLLYAALAIGPMSILSPLTAVVSAVVPMTWGLLAGERLASIGYVALGLALIAVVLVGFVPEKGAVRPRARGILMALGSGVSIGAFMILINQTPHDSGLVPLVLNRAANGAIMFGTVFVLWAVGGRRRATVTPLAHPHEYAVGISTAGATSFEVEPTLARAGSAARSGAGTTDPGAPAPPARGAGWLPGLPLALACGVVDSAGNTLLLLGIRVGDLSVMSVLTALYPAGTIILAALVLKERIALVQWIGLLLALAAAGMLALA